jgi:hypothetical protein
MACAYIDHHLQNDDIESDVILQDVFSTNLVLIWSFMDALNPRVSIANLEGIQIYFKIFLVTKEESNISKEVYQFALRFLVFTTSLPLLNVSAVTEYLRHEVLHLQLMDD